MEDPFLVAPGLRRLTVNLDSDDVALYEGLWPVPEGIALHCYLVQGERIVLVDPWDAGGYGPEEVAADLEDLGLAWNNVVAVAFTKAPAPDLLARLRSFQPTLEDWGVPTPGALHDLGAGVRLEEQGGFWLAQPSGTLLSGDVFSGLGWVEDEKWTEDLGEHEARYFEDEALRWFSARPQVPTTLPTGTRIVAPAHGCLWKTPEKALDRARRFEAWATDGLDEVTVVWPAEDAGADALVGGALDVGAGLNLLRVPGDDPTALAAGARRASLVVVAEGLDDGFLKGLTKDLWRPSVSTPAEQLRQELVRRWSQE